MQLKKVKGHALNFNDIDSSTSSIKVRVGVQQMYGGLLKELHIWKSEAQLIDLLLSFSLHGEEDLLLLRGLHKDLKQFTSSELCNLENEISNFIDDSNYARLHLKFYQIEFQMQCLSETYTELRIKIIHEIIRIYPAKMI